MGVDIGRIERQERLVWILRMFGIGDWRQLVYEMNFQRIPLRELQAGAAIKIWSTGFRRAIIRSIMVIQTDIVNPTCRIEW